MKFRPSKAAPARAGETPKQTDPNANGAGSALDGWGEGALDAAARGEAQAVMAVGVPMPTCSSPVLLTEIMPEPEPDFSGKGGFVTAYGVRRGPQGGFEVVRFYIDGAAVVREELARQPEPYVASAYSYAEKALLEEHILVSAGRREVPS